MGRWHELQRELRSLEHGLGVPVHRAVDELADLGVGGLDARQRIIDSARSSGVPTAPAGTTGPRLDAAAAAQP